ncbi:amino acid ABC transporter ATP-binding protein [Variovorax sp. E3]|uniref:amino acid ABC transporter ATP-binding protein n=1 Tax=Variovorax sp. E3 TaxID=1914993 RepID=UPI0018DC003D|nr:amino acid ABC transporter ATP-binding protein [Variovorax sp. E3]
MNMDPLESSAVVSVRGLTKHFGAHEVLSHVDLLVHAAQRVVVCGPSGSGKSTLARCIGGLESYGSGSVIVNGMCVSPAMRHADLVRANIGMVFQQFNLFSHLTVLDNCTLAQRWVRRRSVQQSRQLALEQLHRVRMADKASAYPAQLSGGQQQRAAIARALCLHPSVMLFDEATSALDPEMVQEVLDTMLLLAREGMTMICITHEMGFARAVADKIVFMEGGRILLEATPGEFFSDDADPRIRRFVRQSF